MSINTNNSNFSISSPELNRAVIQILGGHKESALARLKKLGCSDEIIEKITQFINKKDFTHLTSEKEGTGKASLYK